MSKGTRRYAFRLDPGLIEDMEITVAQRNWWTREEAWTLSDFVRIACREKIQKMARSRRKRPRKKKAPPPSSPSSGPAGPFNRGKWSAIHSA